MASDDGRQYLEHLASDFEYVVRSALRSFIEKVQDRHVYSKRSEANVIHDYMRHYARERFDEHPEVEVAEKGNLVFLKVHPRNSTWSFEVKMKLLDGDLLPRNIKTQQVLDFMNQRGPIEDDGGQLILEGVEGLFTVSIVLGYQPGDGALSDSSVWLVCPRSMTTSTWTWQLETGLAEIVPLTGPAEHLTKPDTDKSAKPKKRVRPKGKTNDSDKKQQGGGERGGSD